MPSMLFVNTVDVARQMIIRSYSELLQLSTFEERYRYLRLAGTVGEETFGFNRWLNQMFYKDPEWLGIRDSVICRDRGCDLAIEDREIRSRILIHHMNPIRKEDILNRSKFLLDPEYLICTSERTHNAIHYGDETLLIQIPIERYQNDTCPWK